jgi:Flp pilus assembly protein TadG
MLLLPNSLPHLFKDRSGGVMPLFALALVPMLGFIGAAVDFSRANSVKAAMQAALDSTALMLSKDAAKLDDAGRQAKAEAYFLSMFHRPEATNVTFKKPDYGTTGGSQLALTVSADVKASFVSVIGFPTLNITSTTTVKWGNNRLRVALGLDNTGSMSDDGKIAALKSATHKLLDSLKNAATRPGDVYVSIVPFSRDVNVKYDDNLATTATWIDWSYWDAANGSCNRSGSSFTSPSACAATQVCSRSRYTTQTNCQENNGTWYTTPGTWTPNDHSTWNGCVMDRDQSNDVNKTAPVSGSTSTMFPADQYSSCSGSLLRLTYDWDALNAKVDAMYPSGNTNQTIGLAWAWHSLNEGDPLNAPPIDTSDGIPTKKIIILLTDGLNTQNRWSTSATSINGREQLACDNAKADGIVIYTVQVNTGNDSLQSVLQNCASPTSVEPKGTKFFMLTSSDQVVTTFDQIGTQLSKLRLSK